MKGSIETPWEAIVSITLSLPNIHQTAIQDVRAACGVIHTRSGLVRAASQ